MSRLPLSLTPQDLGELVNALDDAIGYREPDNGSCHDCTPEAMCDDHQGDKEAADSYRVLQDRIREFLSPERELEAS